MHNDRIYDDDFLAGIHGWGSLYSARDLGEYIWEVR